MPSIFGSEIQSALENGALQGLASIGDKVIGNGATLAPLKPIKSSSSDLDASLSDGANETKLLHERLAYVPDCYPAAAFFLLLLAAPAVAASFGAFSAFSAFVAAAASF